MLRVIRSDEDSGVEIADIAPGPDKGADLPRKRMSAEPLSDIIMAIYGSALAPDGWFNALRRIADFSGSAGCRLVIDDDVTGPVIYSFVHGIESRRSGHRIDIGQAAALAAARELPPIGVPIVRSRASGTLAAAGSGEIWDGTWHGTWDADAEAQLSDGLSILLRATSAGPIMLEAVKTDRQGLYTDDELARMGQLGPHICRAIEISESLNASRLTSEMFEASLDALATGIYFIGQQGRVVYLNRAARALVKSGRVLRLVDDRLVATGRDAQKLLQSELSEIELDSGDRPGRAIALADDEGPDISPMCCRCAAARARVSRAASPPSPRSSCRIPQPVRR